MPDEQQPQQATANVAEQPRSAEWRQRWGLHTPATLQQRARQLGSASYLVEGLIPARSVNLLVGDSGLGKSPLACQLGICVAAGIPFLGRPTRKGRVVIADFENGIADVSELIERISRHVGLKEPPGSDDFFVWTLNDCLPRYGQPGHTLTDMLRDVRPALAIVDSIASYRPEAEEKISFATHMLQEFRVLVRDFGTATLGVHHRRKPSRKPGESAGPLESANLREWFQDTRGASSLINGSDVRLGVDEPDLSVCGKDDLALVLRGFGRIRGEIGPLYLARDCGEDGEPQGYRALTGPELLFNQDQQKALAALPPQFTFKDAKKAYGRSDQPTRNWLMRCAGLGLVKQRGRGIYEQVHGGDAAGDGAHREES